jgi:hypothetical protein
MKLVMITVAALVIAQYVWTPKTGEGWAIYGGIVLAMLIVYFALRGRRLSNLLRHESMMSVMDFATARLCDRAH